MFFSVFSLKDMSVHFASEDIDSKLEYGPCAVFVLWLSYVDLN